MGEISHHILVERYMHIHKEVTSCHIVCFRSRSYKLSDANPVFSRYDLAFTRIKDAIHNFV